MAFHRGKMRAACDEGDIGSGLGQRHTKPASNTSGTDNRNPHGFLLTDRRWRNRPPWIRDSVNRRSPNTKRRVAVGCALAGGGR
jgi:hypothetical protein